MNRFKGIGSLRTRLVLEQKQLTGDGAGGYYTAWLKIAEVWGQITPLTHKRQITIGTELVEISHHVLLRQRKDIKPQMRFRHEEHVLSILFSYDPNMENRLTLCLCSSHQPSQHSTCD